LAPELVITSRLEIGRTGVTSGFCSNTIGGPCFLDIPTLPYFIGDGLAATFTITNQGTAPITLDKLTVGGRFNNGTLPDGQYPDFTFRSVVLNPGDPYLYTGDLRIPYAGNYHFFCAYQTSDGEWHTSIDLGEGLTDEDRTEDIEVDYVASLHPSSDAVIEITNMGGISTKELYDLIKLVLDIDRAKSKIVGEQDESLLEDVNLLLNQLDPGKRTVRTYVEPELPEGTWLELQVIEKLAAPALGAGLTLAGFALLNPALIVAGYELLVLAVPISVLGQFTEMLSMEIGQKVFSEGFALATVKDPQVGTMEVVWLGPPIDKVVVNIYLAKAGKNGSIVISVGQWLNELKMTWGINAQSTEPVWNAFAYPPENTLADPQSIIDYVQIIGFKSPGEVRVYDSQGRVSGLINGEVKEEIPNSVYDNELKTVVLFSPTDTYWYEVVGTKEGTYGLELTSVEEGEAVSFTAVDIPTAPGAVHQYTIDWDALSRDEEGVAIQVDSDGDGITDYTVKGGNVLTGDEFIPQSQFPWCFIATAAYGTPMAEEIQTLREFRDEYLLTNPVGQAFVDFYYRVSPPIAEFITEHPSLKPIVRTGLLPAVAMSTIVVNTTPGEKMVIVGLVVLVSVALAVWAMRRRSRGPERT
jgi:hypothetical protein